MRAIGVVSGWLKPIPILGRAKGKILSYGIIHGMVSNIPKII